MTCEILFSVPFNLLDYDPSEVDGQFDNWSLHHFWIDDGFYTICDSDGNHDEITEKDLPSFDDIEAAWFAYSRYVARTGTDPIHEFMVRRERKVVSTFYFRGVRSIVGPKFMVKRKGDRSPYRSPETYGKDVAAFFTCESLDEVSPSDSVTITNRTCNASSQVTAIRGRATIELKIPRSERAIRRELREIANRHIQRESSHAN